MLRLAIRSTLAKKRRLFGTALSVMIGIAFLAGTLVFTDTIRRTFDNLFEGIYAETDSYVRAEAKVEFEQGASMRDRIPESLVADVAHVRGVAEALPLVSGYAQIVGADGKAIGDPGRGAPTFAMNYVSGPLSPWTLTEGSAAPGPGEAVVDVHSADVGHLVVGEPITLVTQSGPHQLTLVGTVRFGSVDSPGGASVSVVDLRTAQRMLVDGRHEIDAVMVHASPGWSERRLTSNVAAVLPKGVEAVTGTEITEETQDAIHEGLSFFSTFLLVFAAIGLIVACFTIYNTFQIIVSQRSREMALLRSLGATRRQVLTSQLIEALIVGGLASIVGLAAGVAVAGGLKGMMQAFGIDIPAGGTVLAARTAVIAIVVGTVVTVTSAVLPSLRASRVPPLAALRTVTVEDTDGQAKRRRLAAGGIPLVLGIGAFLAGLVGHEIFWVGIGALVAFVGVFALGPLFARPASRVLGSPVARTIGVTGLLAQENAVRNPGRTARTGGALMIGVALVGALTIIAATAKDWTHDVVGRQFSGDYVVATNTFGFGGLSPDVARRLNRLPEVGVATGIRLGAARDVSRNRDLTYVAVDPVTAGELFDIGVVDGSLRRLDDEGVFVDDGEAAKHHLAVGDRITWALIDGKERSLRVEGIYRDEDLAGPYVLSHGLHEQTGADQFDFSVYVAKAPGVPDEQARRAIASVSDDYPTATLQSRSEYIASQAGQVDQIVNLMYGLLALAVIIALISIANSVSLSIHERTRELGLLRAVGMTRHQVASTVRWEAGIVATLGVAIGTVLGVFFGWAISVTLRDEGLWAVTIPVPGLVVIAVLGILGGVLASFRPAWRGAHLDVMQAIAAD